MKPLKQPPRKSLVDPPAADDLSAHPRAERRRTALALCGILVVAAAFRLIGLGDSAFRSDTIEFWKICNQPNLSIADVFSHWMELMGLSGQLPFAVAAAKALINLGHLPTTAFTVRLISALWGVMTVGAAYQAGRALGGRRVGLTMALLLAVDPVHIQATREAYFYPPLVLGAFLALAGVLEALESVRRRRVEALGRQLFLNGTGLFLLTWSSTTGWAMAALCAGIVVGCHVWIAVKWRRYSGLWVLALYGLAGCPLLVADWALPQVLQITTPEHAAMSRRIFTNSRAELLPFLGKTVAFYGWGTTPLRLAFTALIALLGFGALLRGLRRDIRYWVLPVLAGWIFVAFIASTAKTGVPMEPRYVLVGLPLLLAVFAAGIWAAGDLPFLRRFPAGSALAVPVAIMLAALALWIPPSVYAVKLTGKPTPYLDIQRWVNANLPRGTPVLVDRWFEPWNELRIHNSTNVFFTFTIPNEPIDVFLKYNWRGTAVDFFRKYQDAAFLEMKSYWTDKRVGPWDWPPRHFKRHVEFRNEAGLALDRLGLLYRGVEPVYKGGLIIRLFYNTRQDVLEAARAEGAPPFAMYGANWGYTKLWQQIQGDFRDWRVLTDHASIDLYNLTPHPTNVALRIKAVAVGAAARVRLSTGAEEVFPMGQLREWRIPGLVLQAGTNTVEIARVGRDSPNAAVLVEDLRLE